MLPTLLSVFLTFTAHAAPQEPPRYQQSFNNAGCTEPDNAAWRPWTVFSQETWEEEIDADDKRAIFSGHCRGGSVLFSFQAAKRTIENALELQAGSNSSKLRALEKADADSRSRIDTVCGQKLHDGRTACRHCCKTLIGLRSKLVEKKADFQGLTHKEKMARLEETKLRDAKRLAEAGMNADGTVARSREMFDGNSREGAATRTPKSVTVATGEGKAAAGAVKVDNKSEGKYRRELEGSVPTIGKMTRQGYIDKVKQESWFGGEAKAKKNLAAMDQYIDDCYRRNRNPTLCEKVANADEKQLKAWSGHALFNKMAENELLKRKLDLSR